LSWANFSDGTLASGSCGSTIGDYDLKKLYGHNSCVLCLAHLSDGTLASYS